LIFIWQDNNAVLGMTTAHCLKNEIVLRYRKRPSSTSTNAYIVRPVFGDEAQKWLHIPRAIDDYNHFMNGVDRANQLRRNLTVHRPFEHRTWRPLWNYLLDICAVNSGLVWEKLHPELKQAKRGQRRFREALIQQLLSTPYEGVPTVHSRARPMPLPQQDGYSYHKWERMDKRRHCVWCKQHSKQWAPQRAPQRARTALAEVTNTAPPPPPPPPPPPQPQAGRQRESKTYGGCRLCNVYLCYKTSCFERYHSEI
jgi:Transposase IS4